jgi:hypothetical protein
VWFTDGSGRAMRFELAGINNQNFLMRDEETGSWWQQSTGVAVLGPLRGERLEPADFDELTYATWRAEHPSGRVLAPVAALMDEDAYAESGWEAGTAQLPVVTPVVEADPFEPRELVAGVERDGHASAWPLDVVRRQRAVHSELGGEPVVLVASDDGRSVRAFRAPPELQLEPSDDPWSPLLIDRPTGSEWDFTGRAVSGPQVGLRLERLPLVVSYWFDWKQQHPGTDTWRPSPPWAPAPAGVPETGTP